MFALKCVKEGYEQETGRILLFSLLDPRSPPCAVGNRTEEQSKFVMKPMHVEGYEFAKELLRARIGVEHFVFSKDALVSHELATLHFLSSTTGGKMQFYHLYNAEVYYSVYLDTENICTMQYFTL